MASFEVLYQHLCKGTEDNHDGPQNTWALDRETNPDLTAGDKVVGGGCWINR